MKKTHLILVVFLIVFIHFSCKKEELTLTPLPPNTEIGQNTFIFRINGGNIISSKVEYLSTSPRIHVFYNHDDPYFNGKHHFELEGGILYLEEHKFMFFSIDNMISEGVCHLSDYGSSATYLDKNTIYLNSNNTGELDITKLDTTNHIISGSFKFDAKNSQSEDIITVDGQFDVKYKPNEGVNYY
ncbi:MAG: hypothetical protein JEZ09_13895 [Salinivirgaceae bacterium]|nr:hypothetical protein [Salinivirgaceae bacterium]